MCLLARLVGWTKFDQLIGRSYVKIQFSDISVNTLISIFSESYNNSVYLKAKINFLYYVMIVSFGFYEFIKLHYTTHVWTIQQYFNEISYKLSRNSCSKLNEIMKKNNITIWKVLMDFSICCECRFSTMTALMFILLDESCKQFWLLYLIDTFVSIIFYQNKYDHSSQNIMQHLLKMNI